MILLGSISLSAEEYDFVVAKDGSGTHTTVQAAVDACPDNQRATIFVQKGTYEEKVMIGSHSKTSNKLISLIGENAEETIITWDDYNGKTIVYDGREVKSGTPQSATFTVNAVDFYAENITFKNSYTAAQAVAFYNVGDRQTFKNCRFIGWQDTLYPKKARRSYYLNCYIEGATDFICGGGTCLFDKCTIKSLRNGSYITAPEDITAFTTANGRRYYYGFMFRDCILTSESGVVVYLGRPWQATSSSIYLNCTMANIKPEGWSTWSGDNHLSSFFAEYNSVDDSENPIDISKRVTWSYQLSKEEVDTYYTNETFFTHQSFSTAYDPFTLTGGGGSGINNPVTFLPFSYENGTIHIRDSDKAEIYTVAGNLLKSYSGKTEISMYPFSAGTYIVKITTPEKITKAYKIQR